MNQPMAAEPTDPGAAGANQRSAKDFARARRHSRFVSTMRLALPSLAVLWGGVFLLNATFSFATLPDVSIASAGIEDGRLVMQSPEMRGFDRNDRPYQVKADRASQSLTDTSKVDLEKISALLPVDEKTKARVTADFGRYDTNAEHLVLEKNVRVRGARGMNINLNQAEVDMKTGTMKSDDAVTVFSDTMRITADSVQVEDNGARIVFKKRVKTVLQPQSGE